MTDDDWVKHALTDDSVVAEVLFCLGRADKPPPSPALRLDWSVRQRRSRAPATRHNHDDDDDNDSKRKRKKKKKKAESTRASPTTPLSWSGATTSVSGGGGGSEETSKLTTGPGGARSKLSVKNEAINTKRPRKKKTLAELREEETLLLKERKRLRKEIETLQINVQNQRATNESLSRLKLDLESKQKLETDNCLNAQQRSCISISSHKLEVENQEAGFSLPDLNLPADGDFDSSAVFYGIR